MSDYDVPTPVVRAWPADLHGVGKAVYQRVGFMPWRPDPAYPLPLFCYLTYLAFTRLVLVALPIARKAMAIPTSVSFQAASRTILPYWKIQGARINQKPSTALIQLKPVLRSGVDILIAAKITITTPITTLFQVAAGLIE
jgi:hypothetical protein